MDVLELLSKSIAEKASDLHITVAVPPTMRVNGSLISIAVNPLTPEETKMLVKQVLSEDHMSILDEKGEVDCSYSSPGLGRFRVNAFKQRGSYGMALRVVALTIPTMEDLGVPEAVKEMVRKPKGLILVTGPTGSGKSTTLASMIDLINKERNSHILTLEDPIEYLHKHNKSIVNQREIGNDSKSFSNALRSALRQDPDVILVGEMRDLETIAIAITAAETGHLVLSTLHTLGAAKTIDRIIDVFPPHQQQQIRVQLASVIQGVISQQLLPIKDGSGRIAAFEVMSATTGLRNLIREGKTHQIQNSIQTGSKFGMQTMDSSLIDLYKKGFISREILQNQAVDLELIKRMIDI
ncbi:type IV pilus twitching motility protein PilT [Alkaliphilus peptidifermentans]|uniref:Twitching motility protein PilT n=1 Tax=Alkaliphilus peptidifermentans DSM 18978 TaxID=1120976 RepID=A0A1G5KEJ6_9FIRM|nr:type IV pilus twitching motility protein PilT [Alkaliphilus peptidifermentans]SCY98450.1 twitching motility protein PilT [Alkaliphilus peptidifermentans DSM 18978]